MKNSLLALFLCLLFNAHCKGQSLFLEKEEYGFAVGGGLFRNQEISGLSLDGGYSINGVFDIGVSIGYFRYNELFTPNDALTATFASLYISYFMLKQGENIPISLAFNASYERQMYSSRSFDRYNVEVIGNFFSIGASVYKSFIIKDHLQLLPSFSIGYTRGGIDFKGVKVVNEYTEEEILATIAFSLVIKQDSINQIVITPTVSVGQDFTTYGIFCTFIFPENY